MEQSKGYYAFISYKWEDKKEAMRLQHALEYYRLPNHLRQENPALPEYVRPVFRDVTDLEVGELSAQILSALEQSHFLVVVYSPRAATSKLVNDEVEYFISLGRQDKIIPYIIEGIPYASNPNEECYPPSLLELSKDKEQLGANATTRLWNEASGNCMGIRKGHTIYVTSPHFSPDSKRIVTGSVDNTVKIWDIDIDGTVGGYDKVKQFNIQSVKQLPFYSQDGLQITCVSDDSVWVCDVSMSKKICSEKKNNANTLVYNENSSFTTSHDKKEAITINNNMICVSNNITGESTRVFAGLTATIYDFVLSEDDKYLITVSHDSTIKIWDYKSGVCVQTIVDVQNKSVVCSPDNKTIATVSLDYGKLKILEFQPLQDLITQTIERFRDRLLTPEERQMYYLRVKQKE